MATGDWPTATGEFGASVKLILPFVSTAPSKIATLFVDRFTTARSTSGELFEVLVRRRKFAVTIATGSFSEMLAVFVSANGDPANSLNPPFPSPLKTEMLLSP